MPLDQHARRFFEVLREYKDDPSGESLYTDEARKGLHEVALPYFQDLPDDFHTLLDVGCGAGFDAAYFAKRGKQVTAITAAPTPAQKRYAEDNRFEIVEMDMNDLRFPDARFDAVLCKHVLEHSISPLASLWELRTVLQPEGYLFLVLPPHNKTLIESGHFTQGWSIGQMVYCLCVTGYDVKHGAFRARPGNLEAVVRPAPSVPTGRALYELKDRMPAPIRRMMRDEWHGAFPVGAFKQIAWPFGSDQRQTIERPKGLIRRLLGVFGK
ncbi:MAG: class I SAM-dependent methyltransferase [Planctomycetota bacterium]|jgi:SAM-dependent methyltransferase